MKLTINGEIQEVPAEQTIEQITTQLDYDGQAVAVALNGDFVPRSQYAQTRPNEGDEVEIVAPIAGG